MLMVLGRKSHSPPSMSFPLLFPFLSLGICVLRPDYFIWWLMHRGEYLSDGKVQNTIFQSGDISKIS